MGRYEKVSLDLFSVLHVAEASYYYELATRLSQYDAVLFELIVPQKLLTNSHPPRLAKKVSSIPDTLKLARSLELTDQLRILDPTSSPLYFIADAPLEAIQDHKTQTNVKGLISWPYRSVSGGALPSFSNIADKVNRILWALLCCLLPCPEVSLLVKPMLGSSTNANDTELRCLPALIEALLKGRISTARRIAFAQKVERECASQVNEQLLDNIAVMRNKAAIKAVQSIMRSRNVRNVALVYGANHGGNLTRRIEGELKYAYVETKWVRAVNLIRYDEDPVSGNIEDTRKGVPFATSSWWRWSVVWILTLTFYETYCAFDWLQLVTFEINEIRNSYTILYGSIFPLLLYSMRHGAAFLAIKRWFSPFL